MRLDIIYFAEYWNLKIENNKKVTVHSQVTVRFLLALFIDMNSARSAGLKKKKPEADAPNENASQTELKWYI